jgi:hypothetical protein
MPSTTESGSSQNLEPAETRNGRVTDRRDNVSRVHSSEVGNCGSEGHPNERATLEDVHETPTSLLNKLGRQAADVFEQGFLVLSCQLICQSG